MGGLPLVRALHAPPVPPDITALDAQGPPLVNALHAPPVPPDITAVDAQGPQPGRVLPASRVFLGNM